VDKNKLERSGCHCPWDNLSPSDIFKPGVCPSDIFKRLEMAGGGEEERKREIQRPGLLKKAMTISLGFTRTFLSEPRRQPRVQMRETAKRRTVVT
jgi:hypothetical protein